MADTYNELGRLKQTMGQYNDAEVYFTKAMQVRESGLFSSSFFFPFLLLLCFFPFPFLLNLIYFQVFGKRHPKVAQSLKDLGDLYILASRFDEGYSLLEKGKNFPLFFLFRCILGSDFFFPFFG